MVGCRRVKKGTWTAEEDAILLAFVKEYGAAAWNTAHRLFPDLNRSGKSCRLRYLNQLHPRIRRGPISPWEESIILIAHSILGNQWSRIAALLPGRTDNTVKNVVNMRLKRARRNAASVDFAPRAAGMQQVYAPSHSTLHVSPETCNNISLPTSACGMSVLPSLQVATGGTYDACGCPASSPRRYSALVAAGGAPVMNVTAAGMGDCMDEHSLDAGMMTTTIKTLSPMHVTESKKVGASGGANINAAPISSYHAWMMQAAFTAQEPQERLPGTGRLPSDQKPFESLQLPSVQKLFESLQLPSVQMPSVSFPHSSVQEPLRSLEGLELPSVQEPFQSLLLGSELPSVQSHCPQADMANRSSNHVIGDNDLLEAIKLTGYCSSSSNFSVGSPSPASVLDFDDSYLSTLLTGIEAGDQSLITSSTTSFPASSSASLVCGLPTSSSQFNDRSSKQAPTEEEANFLLYNVSSALQQLLAREENPGAVTESLMMMDGIERDLASMVLGSSMWSSMPGACQVGETAGKDCIPDFN